MERDKRKFDVLVKLYDCNQLVNTTFKKKYKKYFNKDIFDYIPNICNFINDPPTDK